MDDVALAREVEIRRLVQAYNAYGDRGRFDELLELFVPDATFTIDGDRTYEGRADIATLFTGTSDALAEWGDDGPFHMRHFTSTHLVEVEPDGAVVGSCYYQVLMPHGLDHWGRYRDRYVVTDDGWRFAARRERRDGMVPDGWAAARAAGRGA